MNYVLLFPVSCTNGKSRVMEKGSLELISFFPVELLLVFISSKFSDTTSWWCGRLVLVIYEDCGEWFLPCKYASINSINRNSAFSVNDDLNLDTKLFGILEWQKFELKFYHLINSMPQTSRRVLRFVYRYVVGNHRCQRPITRSSQNQAARKDAEYRVTPSSLKSNWRILLAHLDVDNGWTCKRLFGWCCGGCRRGSHRTSFWYD